jgi:hypothetical protein
MVSAFRLFAGERINFSSFPDYKARETEYFFDKIVLFFIINVVTIL